MMQSKVRDTDELLELLEREGAAYQLLLTLSQRQTSVFEQYGAKGLMDLIAQKQDVIGRISELDRSLQQYIAHWDEVGRALPAPMRVAVSAAADEIAGLIRRIIQSEKKAEQLVVAARDRLSGQARSVSGGLKAERAYQRPQLAPTGGILDREE